MKVLSFLGAVGLGVFTAAWLLELRHKRFAGRQLLNINDASQEELMRVLGVDAEVAERIVEHRPYPSKLDLLGRMVVPEEIYKSIKNRITHKVA
jgi:predicted DNA-binding helix-hairpin-helix protein